MKSNRRSFIQTLGAGTAAAGMAPLVSFGASGVPAEKRGPDPDDQQLLAFMRTGNPNGGGLPKWLPYTPEKGETMILNDKCELLYDPDRDARKLLP